MNTDLMSYLKTLKQLSSTIPNAKGIDEALEMGLDIIMENMRFQYAIVWLHDGKGGEAVLRPTYWIGEMNLTTTECPIEGSVVGRVYKSGTAEVHNDCSAPDVLYGLDFLSGIDVQNMECIPLMIGFDSIGCIQLVNKADGTDISEDEHNTLDMFGMLVSMYFDDNDAIYEALHKRETIATLRDIRKDYQNGNMVTHVLKGVNVDIQEGECLVLLGESGCGKSTLMNIIGGIDRATSGTYTFMGEDFSHADEKTLTKYRKDNVGFIFQSYNLMPNMTALQNVKYIAELKEDSLDPEEALRIVGLEGKGDSYPMQMSGGQQQRVSIARALAKKPQMILADEPTAALDYETSVEVLQALEERVANGMTLVMVTHNEEIAKMANRVIRMKSGVISSIKINHHPLHARDLSW